ncbi:glycosyltransferase family 4 protein [Myroides pelagicus]|uniref:Glycosyl transferase family 1 n=1 Tax=Myroides pelagicus TaxID=270914 RepID=A0A7K1GJG3_9FLAO|nr:glycosyltransferase family 4 protein [Myroides pelagicus]MEC4114599.1 glycosyltransferase family 4 protein [Myroides pelagicus]MTH28374.1 glycosyl transferase family 1 [Myroides pelagicus]
MKEKVLIVSYYWPPAGGPGVQRWLKFVKYLPDFNIDPVVYIPENPTYPLIDAEMSKDLREGTTILKAPIKEPYKFVDKIVKKKAKTMSAGMIPNHRNQTRIEKILLWIRGNLFIPDSRVAWVKPSIAYLKKYLAENPDITKVITTGPPHSVHLIGKGLKEQVGVKWIADFRDPWTTIGYHKELKLTQRSADRHFALEKEVLTTADHILVTSKGTKKEFEQKTSTPISIITNGYDIAHFGKIELDQKFTISHIGSFLSDRNPRVLWKALSELRKENEAFREAFHLNLIGKVSQDILDTVEEFKLGECTTNYGYINHQESLLKMRQSQVLLLIEIDSEETTCIIPGKLFEYMAAERPILAIGPEEADFFEIIQQTNTGKIALYSEKDKIIDILLEYFKLYQQNQLKVYAMGLQYFSRKRLTERLVTAIKSL